MSEGAAPGPSGVLETLEDSSEDDELGAFCWNSRLWLALRAFSRPPGCPNRKQYEESACRGCGYFEVRTPTRYARRWLAVLYPGNAK